MNQFVKMMDGRGRYVFILIICLWSPTFADPVIPPELYERNFQALVSANLDTCNMKIKITDAKFSTPKKLSPTNITSAPTSSSPSDQLGILGAKGEPGLKEDRSEQGLRGEKGSKGDAGERGLEGKPGTNGLAGPTGETGSKGDVGLKGDKGEPGSKGENGLQGILGPKGDLGTKGERGDQGLRGEKGSKGDTGERGLEGKPGINGVAGPTGETGSKGDQGLKGDKGEPGSKGENGLLGIMGPTGDLGPKGDKGDQGLRGEKGSKGDTGDRGLEGKPGTNGVAGPTGATGSKGDQGLKGDEGVPGLNGPPGMKGDVGPAGKDFTRDELKRPEADPELPGSEGNPAISCAHLNDSESGLYTINPSNSFMINCTGEEMCLEKTNNEIELKPFPKLPFWLHFKFMDLYKIQGSQMAYLLSQSTGVRQTLKYSCYNTEVIPSKNPNNALLLSLWNGQLVGNSPTSESAISYEVAEDTCNMSKNTWESAKIKMTTEFTHQLPVVDIYIKDIREEEQKATLELIELCFTYKKHTSS